MRKRNRLHTQKERIYVFICWREREREKFRQIGRINNKQPISVTELKAYQNNYDVKWKISARTHGHTECWKISEKISLLEMLFD